MTRKVHSVGRWQERGHGGKRETREVGNVKKKREQRGFCSVILGMLEMICV